MIPSWWLSQKNPYYIGNCCTEMANLPDTCLDMVLTSPPYFVGKEYESWKDYNEYLGVIQNFISQSFRLLKPGCYMAVNIGDATTSTTETGKRIILPTHAHIIQMSNDCGFEYKDFIMWKKIHNQSKNVFGSYPYPPNGIVKTDMEFILIFKKPGNRVCADKERHKFNQSEWFSHFTQLWEVSTAPVRTEMGNCETQHMAAFPLEIPKRLIRMYSFYGDVILDPFLGTGTTIVACQLMERNGLGFELLSQYEPIIRKRLLADIKRLDEF